MHRTGFDAYSAVHIHFYSDIMHLLENSVGTRILLMHMYAFIFGTFGWFIPRLVKRAKLCSCCMSFLFKSTRQRTRLTWSSGSPFDCSNRSSTSKPMLVALIRMMIPIRGLWGTIVFFVLNFNNGMCVFSGTRSEFLGHQHPKFSPQLWGYFSSSQFIVSEPFFHSTWQQNVVKIISSHRTETILQGFPLLSGGRCFDTTSRMCIPMPLGTIGSHPLVNKHPFTGSARASPFSHFSHRMKLANPKDFLYLFLFHLSSRSSFKVNVHVRHVCINSLH